MAGKPKSGLSDVRAWVGKRCPGRFLLNEPLAPHTWYRIGGPAALLVYPQDQTELVDLLHECRQCDTSTFLIGDGANLLVADSGFEGVVICLSRHLRSITSRGNTVTAQAGALLREAVYFCEQRGLSGIECLAGIPGTIGGALTMNAGIDSGNIDAAIESVSLLDELLLPRTLSRAEINFGYRSAPQLQDRVLLGCTLHCSAGSEPEMREARLDLLRRRAAKQPLEYGSCGSVFKRPVGRFVGQMVEESGLKGTRRGDAMISDKHAGFIVNLGCASAQDVLYLIRLVRDEIHKRYGIALELEVRFLGIEASDQRPATSLK
jgi:UDP-N-acetylmuramate dehydrogenase